MCCALLCWLFRMKEIQFHTIHRHSHELTLVIPGISCSHIFKDFFAPLYELLLRSCISESSSLWCYVLIWVAFHVSLSISLWLSKTLKVPVHYVKCSEGERNGSIKAHCWGLLVTWLASQWQRKQRARSMLSSRAYTKIKYQMSKIKDQMLQYLKKEKVEIRTDRTTMKRLNGNHSRESIILRSVKGHDPAVVITLESCDALEVAAVFHNDRVMQKAIWWAVKWECIRTTWKRTVSGFFRENFQSPQISISQSCFALGQDQPKGQEPTTSKSITR